MPATTPTYGLPYPEPTDPPNGPSQIGALATEVEAELTRIDARLNSVPVVRKYLVAATWNKPAAATGFLGVWAWVTGGGGGSGGAAATSSELSPAAGGGGGGTAKAWIPATALAAAESVSIGQGGIGGDPGVAGSVGGSSFFGSHLNAPGGGGGAAAGAGTTAAYSTSGGSGGSSFSGTASPRLEYPGTSGMNGLRISASVGFSGNGGASGYGMGPTALGRSTTGAGLGGRVPGGGAAGAMNVGTQAAAAGSDGARGEVVIIEVFGA